MADENDLNINIGINPQGTETGSRRAKKAMSDAEKSAQELGQSLRRIKSLIDPTFAAQEKYNRALADSKRLLDAGRISQQEYTAATVAAKAALDQQTSSIRANSAEAKAAAAEARRAKQEELQASRAATAEAARLAREEAAAKRAAAAQARRDAKEAAAEQRAATREAARLAREAANEAKLAAREKSAAERQASREAAEEEKQAKREQRQAARDAADAAAVAAKTKRDAERSAAQAARDAAKATREAARAEKESADAVRELRGSIDPAFAAQERYNQTMQRATQLLMQNKLQQGEWIQIQRQAKAQMDVNIRSLGRMNSVYVQLGYQAQDVTASIASGINPLVILAQQGGQTAAALAMMGGTTGRVAAFFAGPWGAAIIGATMLLGLFIGKQKEASSGSVDLTDALEVQKASIDKLTESLKEYNKERTKANTNEQAAISLERNTSQENVAEAQRRQLKLTKELAQAQEDLQLAMTLPDNAGGITYYTNKVAKLKADLEKLKVTASTALSGDTETRLTEIEAVAKAKGDEREAIKQAFDREETAARNNFRNQMLYVNSITNEREKQIKRKEFELQLENALVAATKKREAAEAAITKRGSSKNGEETAQFGMPVEGRVTSKFGSREAPKAGASTNHAGIDIAAPTGTPVKAPQVGTVTAVGYSPTLGKYIILDHGGGTTTRFGHLSDNSQVEKGDTVDKGDVIGKVGNTGNSTAPHLHYEVRVNGKAVDPTKGVFAIDHLEAEKDAFKLLDKASKEATDNYVEDLERQQAEAGENYRVILDLQDQKIEALVKHYGDEDKISVAAMREKVQLEKKFQQQILEEQRRGIQAREAMMTSGLNTKTNVQQTRIGAKEDVVDYAQQTGIITEKQALQQKQILRQEEFNLQVAHESKMYTLKMQSIQSQLALDNLPLKARQELNNQIEQLEADHLNRMAEMRAQNARETQSLQLQTAAVSLNKWGQVAQTFTGSLNTAFQGFWTRTMSTRDMLLNIADQLVYKFVSMGTEMLQNWIMTQLGMKSVTAATEAANTGVVVASQTAQTAAVTAGVVTRTGVEAAGAATSTGITLGMALKDIGAAAARGAANTYAAISAIPVVGPFIAPVAAVATLGAILAFGSSIASAEGGWGEVPEDGKKTILHKKEMVLPAKFATPLRQFLTSRPRNSDGMMAAANDTGSSVRSSTTNHSRGGDNIFNYNPSMAYKNMSAEEMLEGNSQTFVDWLNVKIRNGTLRIK